MNIKTAIIGIICATTTLLGCKSGHPKEEMNGKAVEKSPTTYVVAVGMERSGFAGACPGAEYDARRMSDLFKKYSDHVDVFYSEKATKFNVANAMNNAALSADLFIFYYSGHGGSQKFANTGAEEVDGKDEFLCLYDKPMIDNEIWETIKRCKGRVLLIFDCCHSETMFRLPFTMRRTINLQMTKVMRSNARSTVNMICWSGCPDNTYSYGSAAGGMFTNTLLNYYNKGGVDITYKELWEKVRADSKLRTSQYVRQTKLGWDFSNNAVFQ